MEANVTTGAKKLPVPEELCRGRVDFPANGAPKGIAAIALCDMFRVARFGSANIWDGKEFNELYDTSRDVSALRSEKVSGILFSLFLWSCVEW